MNKDELKQYRERIGLTQGELSKALGVANNTVSRWELGQRSIPEFLPLALETIERRLSTVGSDSVSTVGSIDNKSTVGSSELSKPQSAPVSNAANVHRRFKELSGGNVKKSDGSLVVSDNVASDNEGLLKTSIVAERLGVSERTVRDYYDGKSGGVKLVSVEVGTKRFVSESDLNDFIARRGKK
jgi:transcriptional regulator with XRE-family HTH domain